MHQYSAYPTIKDINIITNLFILDSILSAIFLSLFLRSQFVTLNVLLLIIVYKGSAFSL